MHTNISYKDRLTPAFDAVNDVKDWLGPERWDKVSPEMAKVTNCGQFALYASLAGVRGYPVIAWYELYHGQGSWKPEELE